MTSKIGKLLAVSALIILAVNNVNAQQYDLKAPVPLDKEVRYGKLKNGMTYYIRKNAMPENRAEFHIVHKAGAILEDDSQDGLSHFLEHMAFKGTTHFPGKSMLNYMGTIGVKFGTNVNAYTSTDNTNYRITDVPLLREGIIDSCLLVLHDWSGSILCKQEAIDPERNVISEEWRTRRTSDFRAYLAFMPVMFKDSKYAERTIIGNLDIIKNFKRNEILDFYHKWYRPDLQAVIIVGDFDPDKMEKKVKKLMGNIPKSKKPEPIPSYTVPDNEKPLIGIYTDPEITSTVLSMYIKSDGTKPGDKNWGYSRTITIQSLINMMISNRTSELMQQEYLPMLEIQMDYSVFQGGKDAFSCRLLAKPGMSREAFKMALSELERIKRYGFSQPELELVKAEMGNIVENTYAKRKNQYSRSYVDSYSNHFLVNEPAPDTEEECRFTQDVLKNVTLDEVNRMLQTFFPDNNTIITISAPESEKEKLPEEAELMALLDESKTTPVEPYQTTAVNKPLIARKPIPGKVVKENPAPFGATEWTLSNGIRVVLKATDFKDDEIRMSAFSKGGYSLLPDSLLPAGKVFSVIINNMGLGELNPIELSKALTGKTAAVGVSMNNLSERIAGYTSIKDIETMFQLTYLKFTQPRFDKTVFNNFVEWQRLALEQAAQDPDNALSDSVTAVSNNYHPRAMPFSKEMLAQVSLAQIEAIYKDRFCDPNNFTFIFTGDINPDTLKFFAEKYLASLPTVTRNETWKDEGIRPPKGKVVSDFRREMEIPKLTLVVYRTGQTAYSQQKSITMKVLGDILRIRYTQSIREELGGTYVVSAKAWFRREPEQGYTLGISCDANPELADTIRSIINAELRTIAENGPLDDDLKKVKEFQLKMFDQEQRENSYWANVLESYYWAGQNYNAGYRETLMKINAEDVQQAAQTILKEGNEMVIMMRPPEE